MIGRRIDGVKLIIVGDDSGPKKIRAVCRIEKLNSGDKRQYAAQLKDIDYNTGSVRDFYEDCLTELVFIRS